MTDQPTPAPPPYATERCVCGREIITDALHILHYAPQGSGLGVGLHKFAPSAVEPAPPVDANRRVEELERALEEIRLCLRKPTYAYQLHTGDEWARSAFSQAIQIIARTKRPTPSPAPSSAEVEAAREAARAWKRAHDDLAIVKAMPSKQTHGNYADSYRRAREAEVALEEYEHGK